MTETEPPVEVPPELRNPLPGEPGSPEKPFSVEDYPPPNCYPEITPPVP